MTASAEEGAIQHPAFSRNFSRAAWDGCSSLFSCICPHLLFQGKLKAEAGKGWAETWDVNGNCSD